MRPGPSTHVLVIVAFTLSSMASAQPRTTPKGVQSDLARSAMQTDSFATSTGQIPANFPDCNNNGINDAEDIANCDGDPSCSDCNNDGSPDECGVFIDCDIYETKKLTASDAATNAWLGNSVAVSGDTAIVGARIDECAAENRCGSAYIYRFNGVSWFEQQKLTAPDAAAFDEFAISVSVSGNTAAVGSLGDDCAAGRDCGSVYIFRFNGTSWVLEEKLTASDADASDQFGVSVSLSGNMTVVGAVTADCAAGNFCGAAYVFRFNGTSWVEEQKLTASDANPNDRFGISVSASGDAIVVGTRNDDCLAGPLCGSAYVFRFDGTVWFEERKLSAFHPEAGEFFGRSVSVSGDTVVAGAPGDECTTGSKCGSAYVFRFDGARWFEEQKLIAPDAAPGDRFGTSVSLSGDMAVVGASSDDCAAGFTCGSAYVFRFDGTKWVERQKLNASDAGAGDQFGRSVCVSGETAVVGAWHDDFAGCRDCGSAYIFNLSNSDCNCNGFADVCEIAGCDGDPGCGDCDLNEVLDVCQEDFDGDDLIDDCDLCPESQMATTITFGLCDSGVSNIVFHDGCTMADRIAECAQGVSTHGEFVSCVAQLTNDWKQDGLISGREKGRIQRCAAHR